MQLAKVYVTARGDTSQVAGDLNRGKPAILGAARGITSSLTSMFSGVAASLGLMAGAGAFVQLLRGGEEFNRAMRGSFAIMGNVSDMMRGEMKQAALEVASATVFTGRQTAAAFYYLASAGLDAGKSIGALPLVAQFAQAGLFDLAKATSLLTDAQSALGMKSDDVGIHMEKMRHIGDMLVKANTLADASVLEFAEALSGPLAGALRANKRPLEEGIALLTLMAERGVKGAEASMKASILYRDLPRAIGSSAEEFKKYGIEIADAQGKMLPMGTMIDNLTRGLAGLSDIERAVAFDAMMLTRGVRDVIMKLFGGGEELRKFRAELLEAGGTMEDVSKEQLTPFQDMWAELSTLMTTVGAKFMAVLKPVLFVTEHLAAATRELVEEATRLAKLPWKGLKWLFEPLMLPKEASKAAKPIEEIANQAPRVKILVDYFKDLNDASSDLDETFNELRKDFKKLGFEQLDIIRHMTIGSNDLTNRIRELHRTTLKAEMAHGRDSPRVQMLREELNTLLSVRRSVVELNKVFKDSDDLIGFLSEALSRLVTPQQGLEKYRIQLQALVDEGFLKAANAQKLLDEAFKEMPEMKAAEQFRKLNEEIFRLTHNLTDAQLAWRDAMIATRKFMEQPFQRKEDVERMKDIQKALAGAKIEAAGREFAESLWTPAEKALAGFKEIRELFLRKAISPEIAIRGLERLQKGLAPPPLEAGRFGFADFGKRIQDTILKRDDPQKRLVKIGERQVSILDIIKNGINAIEKQLPGVGTLK